MTTGTTILILGGAFVTTLMGTRIYRGIAERYGIMANPNFRSLHERPIPRGGGVVFSIVIVAAVVLIGGRLGLEPGLHRALVLCGSTAALFGFIDDLWHLKALNKFTCQAALAAATLLCVGVPLVDLPWTPQMVDFALSWFALVWLTNLYNFIDGIDGLAASCAVLISGTAWMALLLSNGPAAPGGVFAVIASCCAAFLIFNWPRASIFMGDAGSVFLGVTFGAMMAGTSASGAIGPWTWLAIFAFPAGDTTTTTVLRVFVTDRWYGEHRSHAYQNLARITGSHRRVVVGVLVYHVIWVVPCAVVSVVFPSWAPLSAAAAVLPVVAWTLRHGPLRSSS